MKPTNTELNWKSKFFKPFTILVQLSCMISQTLTHIFTSLWSTPAAVSFSITQLIIIGLVKEKEACSLDRQWLVYNFYIRKELLIETLSLKIYLWTTRKTSKLLILVSQRFMAIVRKMENQFYSKQLVVVPATLHLK